MSANSRRQPAFPERIRGEPSRSAGQPRSGTARDQARTCHRRSADRPALRDETATPIKMSKNASEMMPVHRTGVKNPAIPQSGIPWYLFPVEPHRPQECETLLALSLILPGRVVKLFCEEKVSDNLSGPDFSTTAPKGFGVHGHRRTRMSERPASLQLLHVTEFTESTRPKENVPRSSGKFLPTVLTFFPCTKSRPWTVLDEKNKK
jgi:hypothetical protein